MDRTNTFDLEDLNDDFWERVVYFEMRHSSGLGGPGCVWFVTEDGKKYYLGFEDIPFSEYELEEHLYFPFYKQPEKQENSPPRYQPHQKTEGWHRLFKGCAYVREDLWPALQKAMLENGLSMEKIKRGFTGLLDVPRMVGLALGTEKLERVDYIRSAIWQENYNREMKKMEGERERNKLTTEHFDWKPLYPNNEQSGWQQWGWYAMLFTEKEGRIQGKKFSIVFQRKEVSPMCQRWGDDEVERYNLFVKSYDDVVGPLHHPSCEKVSLEEYREQLPRDRKHKMPPNIAALTYYEWTTLGRHEVNDYGSFRRSFQSLEEAKEYAMCVANTSLNKNIIVKDLENPMRDHRLRVEKYEAYLAYRKYHSKILDAVCDFDGYPDESSGGGGFIFDAVLAAVPEITERQLRLIRDDLPFVLEGRTQRYLESERLHSLAYLK